MRIGSASVPLNVQRVDHHYFHGFVVAVKRRGVRHTQYVSDRASGSQRAGFLRALRARDRLLAQLPPLTKLKSRNRRNTSGVIGVSRVRDRTRAGRVVWRYAAAWVSPSGSTVKRSFSVRKYGAAGARERAVRARAAGVLELLRARARRSR